MEIWSRLIGGSSTTKKQHSNSSPQQRLIRFKKAHDQLQQIWRRSNTSFPIPIPAEPLHICFQTIRQLLRIEAQTPGPYLCARHVSTFHLHTTLAQLASTSHMENVIVETLDIFKVLLDIEEGDFVKDKSFADALIGFISTVSTAGPLSADIEARNAEVLFGIAAKLRLQPEILPTWFRPNTRGYEYFAEGQQKTVDKDEFLLFYLTLDYVHHDGKAGDFARTGLLYLVESAAYSVSLEQWIIESDIASMMASGLGALYSQLSRKLVLTFDKDCMPAITTFSETSRPPTPTDAEKTTSPDFKAHLATFLSYLVFWQDVLEHCSSTNLKQSLLDHFKFLFLQQLLYPSLIESSDADGGSSVAVLTYLKCLIESVDNPDLLRLIFEYLLAIPDKVQEEVALSRPTALARRRKSQQLITNLSQGQEKPLPDLFTLVDLVMGSLRSRNQQTVTATLRLISMTLRIHLQYDFSIIKMTRSNAELPRRTRNAHERDTAFLFSKAEDLFDDGTLGDMYELHLDDAQTLLESHRCSAHLLALPGADCFTSPMTGDCFKPVQFYKIAPEDKTLNALVTLLENFLTNDIETNLSLTQAFSNLASCASLRLDPWLLEGAVEPEGDFNARSTSNGAFEDPNDDIAGPVNNRTPVKLGNVIVDNKQEDQSPVAPSLPTPVFAALDALVQQVDQFRNEVHNFDTYLAERRHIFRVGEDSEKEVANDGPAPRRSQEYGTNTPLKSKPVAQIGSISTRLMSGNPSANESRSSSPRGRPLEIPPGPKLIGRLNHLRIPPSPSPSKSSPRAFSPSPLRKPPLSSTPPNRHATPVEPADILRQKFRINIHREEGHVPDIDSETSSIRSDSIRAESANTEQRPAREVSLSHLLTNAVILQEFILELAAIVEVRARLFGEVTFV